jgi:hypothetical protein
MHIYGPIGKLAQKHVRLRQVRFRRLNLRLGGNYFRERAEVREIRRRISRCTRAYKDDQTTRAVGLDQTGRQIDISNPHGD